MCRFLCASSQGLNKVIALGELPGEATFEDLRNELNRQNAKVKQVVLLLPRSELDFNFLDFPDVDDKELAQLVHNLVVATTEISGDGKIATDFIVCANSESEGKHALAWSLPELQIKTLKDEARQSGFQLKAVTFEGFGAVSLWRNQLIRQPADATVFSVTSNSIDFTVIRKGTISQMRSIPFQQTSEQGQTVSARLIDEYRRTMTVMGIDLDSIDDEPARAYMFGATDLKKEIVENLTRKINVSVSVLNPLEKVDFSPSANPPNECDEYVQLLGIATSWGSGKLEIDLCNPRQPETRRLPWRQIAGWASPIVLLCGLFGYVVFDNIRQGAADVELKQKEFLPLLKQALLAQELGDELAAIRDWRKDEVVWLDQLEQLTDKLPPREHSLIRRINMTSTSDGTALINLSVEVDQADLVLQMENGFRQTGKQVTSKRVSESSSGNKERWSFETSVRFPVVPPKLSFSQPVAASQSPDPSDRQPADSDTSAASGMPKISPEQTSANDPANTGGLP